MPPKKPPTTDKRYEIGFVIFLIFLLWYIWSAIFSSTSPGAYWQSFVSWYMNVARPILTIVAIILSILLAYGFVYSYRKLSELNRRERLIYGPAAKESNAPAPLLKNERWERVVEHLNSPNAGEWRLSIIEADIMLDELLRAQGYHGESVGEMLKAVEKSDFTTLDAAWEAHKVRNEIAHSGSDYYLTEREAKRVIALYESVFREFKVI